MHLTLSLVTHSLCNNEKSHSPDTLVLVTKLCVVDYRLSTIDGQHCVHPTTPLSSPSSLTSTYVRTYVRAPLYY
jgi:hypothetical protein